MDLRIVKRNICGVAALLVLVLAVTGPAMAQSAAPATRPGPAVRPSVGEQPQPGQQNEFLPVKELPAVQQEHIPAAPLVMVAYAFVWVALLLYVWSVARRLGAVQRELADLRRRTERKA